jgi:hypothetical protein
MCDLNRLLESSDAVIDILYYRLSDGHGKRSPVKGIFFNDGSTIDANTKACSALEEALDLKAGGARTLKLFANDAPSATSAGSSCSQTRRTMRTM